MAFTCAECHEKYHGTKMESVHFAFNRGKCESCDYVGKCADCKCPPREPDARALYFHLDTCPACKAKGDLCPEAFKMMDAYDASRK